MGLWDTDKKNDGRDSPSLNQADALVQRMANGTVSVHPKTDATGSAAFTQTSNGRMLVNDGTNNRVVVGALPDGTFGMKVSQPGIDVTTATNDKLVFNSGQDVFKIVSKGTATVNQSAGNINKTIVTHNLGYLPIVLAYFGNSGTSYVPLPMFNYSVGASLTLNQLVYVANITPTTFEIWCSTASGSAQTLSFPVTYYLLQETAN